MDSKKTIDQWVDDKLRDVCHVIGIFVKYILYPRDDYKTHTTAYINTRIVRYVVEEILNCKILKLIDDVAYVPKGANMKIEKHLQTYVIDKFTDVDVVYDPDVVEYLWKYVSVCISKLLQGINRDDNNAVKGRIQSYRNAISSIGDSDINTCFVKSMCYLSVTLSDWLETPSIGELELKNALHIIIPKDLHYEIESVDKKYDTVLEKTISDHLFDKYNIKLSSSGKEYLSSVFGVLEYTEGMERNSELYYKFNNRVRYFSQQVIFKTDDKPKIANTGAGVASPSSPKYYTPTDISKSSKSPYVDTINTDPLSKVYKLGYGGTTRWMSKKSNKLHSVNDKPAIIREDGTREWFKHGVRHRDNGPAVKKADGTEEWWIDGVEI